MIKQTLVVLKAPCFVGEAMATTMQKRSLIQLPNPVAESCLLIAVAGDSQTRSYQHFVQQTNLANRNFVRKTPRRVSKK